MATWKRSTLPGGSYEIREMLVPVFLKGQCVYQNPSTMEIREYCQKELNTLWDETRRLVNPQEVFVDLSKPLYDLKQKLLNTDIDAEMVRSENIYYFIVRPAL